MEAVRFELTDPFEPLVFKTSAIGLSATLPCISINIPMTANPFRKYIDIIREAEEVIDRPPVRQREEVPLHIPGGFTVCIQNDPITPFQVVIEAVVAATGLDVGEATRRMMQAHTSGLAPVAAYASRDVAETRANQIEQHARSNRRWDELRRLVPPRGWFQPWPLQTEVLDAGG